MKKVLSIVIAMAMTLSLLTLGAAAKGTYSDTQGTWVKLPSSAGAATA